MPYVNFNSLFLSFSKFLDRVISVEYAVRDDDDRRNGHSPDRRGRDMSPDKRTHDRGRSPSPYRRDRGSPDYGRGSNPSSRAERRGSPNYNRDASPVSDGYQRYKIENMFAGSELVLLAQFLVNCLLLMYSKEVQS